MLSSRLCTFSYFLTWFIVFCSFPLVLEPESKKAFTFEALEKAVIYCRTIFYFHQKNTPILSLLVMFGIMNTFIGGESASTPEKSQGQPQKDQCDMFINVVYSGDKEKSASQNPNHEWFLKKRKFLERKGLLRSKSEPYIPPYKHRRDKAKAEGSHSQRPKVIFKHDTTRPQPAKVNPKVEPGVRRPVSGRPSKRSRKSKKAKLLNPAVAGPAIAQRAPVPGDVSDSNRRAISLLDGLNIPALAPASINPSKYAAIDCEMVGGGPQGQVSMLARCSVVSYEGDVIFDEYIKPDQLVTCYRTRWSGIRPRDLVNAMPFQEAKKRVTQGNTSTLLLFSQVLFFDV